MIASRGATPAVDREQRIHRLRARRLERVRAALERSELAAGPEILTGFPAEELLVAGRRYVRGANLVQDAGCAPVGL